MKVAIYARVSTKDQDNEIQIRELTAWALRQGFQPILFSEKASGKNTTDRPEYQKMLLAAHNKEISAIAVYRLDRFGRNLKDILIAIDMLQNINVNFFSIGEGIDLKSPFAKVILALLGSLAELEREKILERTSAGRALAMEKGVKFGPKPKISQYQVDFIREKLSLGWTPKEIAKPLKVHRTTVVRVMAKVGLK